MAFRETITYVSKAITNYQTADEFWLNEVLHNAYEIGEALREFDLSGNAVWDEIANSVKETMDTSERIFDVATQTLTWTRVWETLEIRNKFYDVWNQLITEEHPLFYPQYNNLLKDVISIEELF